eukprot:g6211.t1
MPAMSRKKTLTKYDPAFWMNPQLRALIKACRPWSVPVSIIPIALAGTVLQKSNAVTSLLSVDFVLILFCGVCVHLGANLTNTYFDFFNGVDSIKYSDDRALVDGEVSPSSIGWLAVIFYSLAAACASYFCFFSSVLLASNADGLGTLLKVFVAGFMLSFFYTAGPMGLKYIGLGDIVVFLCFGPLLMQATSLCLTGTTSWIVLCYSLATGLLTVAILHANNTRDIEVDSRAGGCSLAISLGKEYSYFLYCCLVIVPYFLIFTFASSQFGFWESNESFQGLSVTCVIMMCSVPWALYLLRCFKRGLQEPSWLAIQPQRTAQFELLWGTCVIVSLAPPLFVGRFLLACLFYLGGVQNVLMWSHTEHMVAEKLRNVIPATSVILIRISFGAATALQILASICFIIGVRARFMAKVLLLFLVPVTFLVHDFWTIEDDKALSFVKEENQAVDVEDDASCKGKVNCNDLGKRVATRSMPTFLKEFDNEFVHFFKNLNIIGGILLYLILTK